MKKITNKILKTIVAMGISIFVMYTKVRADIKIPGPEGEYKREYVMPPELVAKSVIDDLVKTLLIPVIITIGLRMLAKNCESENTKKRVEIVSLLVIPLTVLGYIYFVLLSELFNQL